MTGSRLTQDDYTALAEFRYLIRSFLQFSEDEAQLAGLTPRQHQALLAIKGYGRGEPISTGDLASRLKIRHNTAVELAKRLEEGGLIRRSRDPVDHRRVLLQLSEGAEHRIAELSGAHLDELRRILPLLQQTLERYSDTSGTGTADQK